MREWRTASWRSSVADLAVAAGRRDLPERPLLVALLTFHLLVRGAERVGRRRVGDAMDPQLEHVRVAVAQAFQRTRALGGRAVVWVGVTRGIGRGEGSSGLAFDRLVDVPPEEG
jgi:hypothetical protein